MIPLKNTLYLIIAIAFVAFAINTGNYIHSKLFFSLALLSTIGALRSIASNRIHR